MQKIAILLRGGVSKIDSRYEQSFVRTDSKVDYIDYNACYLSIQKHIIQANPEYSFDFFIHCWNTDLEKNLIDLYKPLKSTFEDNHSYSQELQLCLGQLNQASQALSIKKGIELIQSTDIDYHQILIYRPDVLLIKDLVFDKHPSEHIYVDNWHDCNSDLLFLMNSKHANEFKLIYDHCRNNKIKAETHVWFKKYIETFMKQKLYGCHIKAAKHIFIIRNLIKSYKKRIIQLEQLNQFGLTEKIIRSYTNV